jgi:hypothetical protein
MGTGFKSLEPMGSAGQKGGRGSGSKNFPVFRSVATQRPLPRRIFFADQGEFTTGDYEEIMNKASCLSLVSNAILYWNTIKINDIVEKLRSQGEDIDKETLSHISLLPFKHVVPNGTYFIEDV